MKSDAIVRSLIGIRLCQIYCEILLQLRKTLLGKLCMFDSLFRVEERYVRIILQIVERSEKFLPVWGESVVNTYCCYFVAQNKDVNKTGQFYRNMYLSAINCRSQIMYMPL